MMQDLESKACAKAWSVTLKCISGMMGLSRQPAACSVRRCITVPFLFFYFCATPCLRQTPAGAAHRTDTHVSLWIHSYNPFFVKNDGWWVGKIASHSLLLLSPWPIYSQQALPIVCIWIGFGSSISKKMYVEQRRWILYIFINTFLPEQSLIDWQAISRVQPLI